MRVDSTDAEKTLWRRLRGRLLLGRKFYRQKPIPPYIVDFYCYEERLVIELDGGQHADIKSRNYDLRRTHFLEMRGLRVMRIWNGDVLANLEGVLQTIALRFEKE